MNRALIIILCLVTLYSCEYMHPDDASPASDKSITAISVQTYVYECPDDFSFIARIENDKAWLFLPGKTINLPQVQSASGSKYTSNGYTFRSKGEEAMIKSSEGKHSGCKNNRAKAIWEQAKLNGADFRAVGNEPGWHMEISNKRDIVLVTDYGQHTYRLTSSVIKSLPHSNTTIYNASNNGNMIEVVIKGDPCRDSMSGETFAATVSVLVNEKRYSGCGKALH